MLSLSKKSDYGLVLLSALARQPASVHASLRQLSRDHHLPYKFLSHIALSLKSAGIITSKEGLKGGYRLQHSPSQINLYRVLTALEGPLALTPCLKGFACSRKATCSHYHLIAKLSHHLISTLKQTSLADIV